MQKSAQSLNLMKLNSSVRSMTILTDARHVTRQPQSAHFNKDQYTLYCTVAHSFDEDVFSKYIYHFSNDTSHDSQFSHANVGNLMTNNDNV